MASFKIHEDQENRRPELVGKENAKNVLQPKRTILGVLDNNKPKIPVGLKQAPHGQFGLKSKNENNTKPQCKPKSFPVIPVAQFQAFNVYEDKSKEKKLEDAKIIKTELKLDSLANDVATTVKIDTPMSEGSSVLSPMSVDKSLDFCTVDTVVLKVKKEREIFFDMPEYRSEIYSYLRDAECRGRPKYAYMLKQPDITYSMRTILVDWLVEVAEEYRLQTETLYLAVSYIDRFLSYMSVVRAKLQLVGTAAMFIAAKYEEIYPPDVGEFVYITDDTYNKKQVLRMEQLILKVLGFDISIPTPLTFLTQYCVANEQSEKVLCLSMYLCELSMLDADLYLQYLPSQLAAAAIYVSRETLDLESWSVKLEKDIGYSYEKLEPCIKYLISIFTSAPSLPQQAIQEKYKANKYHQVSMLLPRIHLAN